MQIVRKLFALFSERRHRDYWELLKVFAGVCGGGEGDAEGGGIEL